jgi:hypothetical protein
MPFSQLVNAQQVQITVAGPGDANTLYLCKGLAQGNFSVQVPANGFQQANDTWQFEVGPTLSPGQFRQAIATSALAGVQEAEAGSGQISWAVQTVFADFDGQSGLVRVSVTNAIQVFNQTATAGATAGVSMLSYDVAILAAIPSSQ